MQKEYHLFLDWNSMFSDDDLISGIYIESIADWIDFKDANIIYTILPCTLTTNLFSRGYRVYIHDLEGKTFEIKLGKNECTSRIIKKDIIFLNY